MRVGCLGRAAGTLRRTGGSPGAPHVTEARLDPVSAVARGMLTYLNVACAYLGSPVELGAHSGCVGVAEECVWDVV